MDLTALFEEVNRERAPFEEAVKRLDWRVSERGDDFVNIGSFNVVVYRRKEGWLYHIMCQDSAQSWCPKEPQPTALDAKRAALRFLESLKPQSTELSRMLKEIRADLLGREITRVGNVIYVKAWRKSGSNKYGNTINKHH